MCDDNAFMQQFFDPLNDIRAYLKTEEFSTWNRQRQNVLLTSVLCFIINPEQNNNVPEGIINNVETISEIYRDGLNVSGKESIVPLVIYEYNICNFILNALNDLECELPILVYNYRPQWVQDLAIYQTQRFRL